jgi:hypothetical protein
VGLERGPLSLTSTIEELLGRKSKGSGQEIREYCRRDPSCWPHGTIYPQKLAPTSPTSGGCSVGIIGLRTQATEFGSCSKVLCYVIILTLLQGMSLRFIYRQFPRYNYNRPSDTQNPR